MKTRSIILILFTIFCGYFILSHKHPNPFDSANQPSPEISPHDDDHSGDIAYDRYVNWRIENDLISRGLLGNSEKSTSDTDKQDLIKAALKNHPQACFELATQHWPDAIYLKFGPSVSEGKEHLLELASKSNMNARAHLGVLYLGSDNKYKYEKARDLLESSALENISIARAAYITACLNNINWTPPPRQSLCNLKHAMQICIPTIYRW